MSDRFDSDRDDERPAGAPSEGVRILGAEEAQAALRARDAAPGDDAGGGGGGDDDRGAAAEPVAAEPLAAESLAAEPDGGSSGDARPAASEGARDEPTDVHPATPSPASPAEHTWSASGADRTTGGSPTGSDGPPTPVAEPPQLPHWTEAPTGAVPAIFADDTVEPDDDLDAWATVTGGAPRFRAEGADWADADYLGDDLSGEHPKLGALADAPPDDEAAFAQELEARRRRTPRGRAARTITTGAAAAGAGAGGAGVAGEGGPAKPRPRRGPRPPARPPAEPAGELSPPGPAQARDLPTAIVTAGVVAVVALICFTQGPAWTNVLAAVILGLGALEFTATLRHRGFRSAAPLALLASAAMPLAAREYGTGAYPVVLGLVVVFTMLWFLWEVTPGRPLVGVATTVLAFAYVGGLGGFAGLLLASPDGVGLVLGVALCAIAYDIVGFFVGSQFGKSPIAPRTSPNKSFEGTLAGMLAAVVVGWVLVGGGIAGGIAPWSPGRGAVLGLFVAVGAFLGDLCESMIKRDLGIKDFGSMLPGHGGVLDRFDAILFCLPITYFLALHFDIL